MARTIRKQGPIEPSEEDHCQRGLSANGDRGEFGTEYYIYLTNVVHLFSVVRLVAQIHWSVVNRLYSPVIANAFCAPCVLLVSGVSLNWRR